MSMPATNARRTNPPVPATNCVARGSVVWLAAGCRTGDGVGEGATESVGTLDGDAGDESDPLDGLGDGFCTTGIGRVASVNVALANPYSASPE